jgi:hypothetical protein
MNGCNFQEHLYPELQRLLPPGSQTFYGGCGGTILRKDFFESIPFETVERVVSELSLRDYPSDQILTFLTRKFGGAVGSYTDFAEEWYPNILELKAAGKVAVLHNYKKEYGLPLMAEEAAELGFHF